jgi:hypothetical protein
MSRKINSTALGTDTRPCSPNILLRGYGIVGSAVLCSVLGTGASKEPAASIFSVEE